jgi:coatomer protein complex subunit alpha (xenin)
MQQSDSVQSKWLSRRRLPADLVAAGEFEEALNVLRRRLGVINVDPFEPLFKEAYWATCSALPSLPQAQAINWPLVSCGVKSGEVAPVILFKFNVILEKVKQGMTLTTKGDFSKASEIFRSALHAIPLSEAADYQEETKLVELINVCRDYVNFTRMEAARKQLDPVKDVVRNIEMAAYLSCVMVSSKIHQCLALRVAMQVSVKNGNFVTGASFAKRLIQGSWGDKCAPPIQKTEQILEICEEKARDKYDINFDVQATVEDVRLCAGSFTLIPPSDAVAKCPYCGATYHASFKGKLCSTCNISEIGANTLGICLRPL